MVLMRQRHELRGKLLIENSWDWQIVDALTPQPGDHIVRKSRYSGFCRTDLEAYLRASEIRYLLFTGVATNVCVESTARDAFFARILAHPCRGRDEPFRSRFQPPGDAVEFRVCLRLGDQRRTRSSKRSKLKPGSRSRL